MFKANWKEVNKDVRIPFNSWIDIITIKAYIEVYKQLLYYIFQFKNVEPGKRLVYELTGR